ncbi:MAG: imidazole glycerol phosphate synthase subunit HisH [Jannaschia sp.]
MSRIGIVDYGVGNLGSLQRAFEQIGAEAGLIDDPARLDGCDAAVLPGVGAFTDCMELLQAGGWLPAISAFAVDHKRPLLGVCVGMQLLAQSGVEGAPAGAPTPGLGLVAGTVVHLRDRACTERVPHVGWNALSPTPQGAALFAGIPEGTDTYFVHSYTFVPEDPASILATTDYGVPLVAAVGRDNIWGTQFHPEKSSRAGFRILRNFLEAAGC